MKKVYAVRAVQRCHDITIAGCKKSLSFENMADGCIGVMACFTNKRKAKKYAGPYGILELEADSKREKKGE